MDAEAHALAVCLLLLARLKQASLTKQQLQSRCRLSSLQGPQPTTAA